MYSSRQTMNRNASDPYKVLGVNRSIAASELRSKWKQAVRRCHPDRGGTNLAMAQVSDAYEILMKPNLRKIYDRFGRRGLEALKTRKRRGFRKQSVRSRPHHPKARQKDRERSRSPKPKRQTKDPIRAILPISLSDAYKGRTKFLSVRYEEECTTCCTDEQVCPFCYGHGKYVGVGEDMCNIQQTWKDCEHCKGTGVKMTAEDFLLGPIRLAIIWKSLFCNVICFINTKRTSKFTQSTCMNLSSSLWKLSKTMTNAQK